MQLPLSPPLFLIVSLFVPLCLSLCLSLSLHLFLYLSLHLFLSLSLSHSISLPLSLLTNHPLTFSCLTIPSLQWCNCLGVVQYSDLEKVTIADIPGLVEGASEDKGLGHDFLRHVERTNVRTNSSFCTHFWMSQNEMASCWEKDKRRKKSENLQRMKNINKSQFIKRWKNRK